jgi:hypothetical protein
VPYIDDEKKKEERRGGGGRETDLDVVRTRDGKIHIP